MTEKDLREIKRRFRPDKNTIHDIKGALVNEKGEIVKLFEQAMSSCNQNETEMLLNIMKKTLGGGMGTNLISLEYTPQQVMELSEHKLLMSLYKSMLSEEEPIITLFEKIASSVHHIDGSYLILIASDRYDVYTKTKDGENGDSNEVFNYFVCCVCPVKPLKNGLCFHASDSTLRELNEHTMIGAPEMGFLFPAFSDRTTDIYNALYYTRDISDIHELFIKTVFNTEVPMSAVEQKDTFDSCLREALEDECDYQVVRSVHDQVSEMIAEHKETKQEEPLKISKNKLKTVLEYCGVNREKVEKFAENYEEKFGSKELEPKNIVSKGKFEVSMPDVSIKVNPTCTDLVSTQVINGIKYIMICVNDNVEVNGVKIDIK